jgi:hypothetical protein
MQYNFATAIQKVFGPETGKDVAGQKATMGYLGLVTIGQPSGANCLIVEW